MLAAGRAVSGRPSRACSSRSHPAMNRVIFARDVAPPSTASSATASKGPSRYRRPRRLRGRVRYPALRPVRKTSRSVSGSAVGTCSRWRISTSIGDDGTRMRPLFLIDWLRQPTIISGRVSHSPHRGALRPPGLVEPACVPPAENASALAYRVGPAVVCHRRWKRTDRPRRSGAAAQGRRSGRAHRSPRQSVALPA